MTLKRNVATPAIIAAMFGMTATAATAGPKPKKCPPGQTAVITLVGVDLVETCRVL